MATYGVAYEEGHIAVVEACDTRASAHLRAATVSLTQSVDVVEINGAGVASTRAAKRTLYTLPEVTDARIRVLRREAVEAGDTAAVLACNAGLRGDQVGRSLCALMLATPIERRATA